MFAIQDKKKIIKEFFEFTVLNRKNIYKQVFVILIFFLALYSLFLRLYSLGEQSLWIDEGYSINSAQSILEEGHPIFDPEGGTYNSGVLTGYLISFFMNFGFNPFNPWVARLPSVFFGIAIIFAVYFLGLKFFKNKDIAFWSSLIIAFSEWEIAWSRQARGQTALQFFIIIAVYFLWQGLKKHKPFYFILFCLFFIIAHLCHPIAIAFVPSFIIILTGYIFFGFNKHLLNKLTAWLFIVVAIIGINIMPIIFNTETYYNAYTYLPYIFKYFLSLVLIFLIGTAWGIFFDKNNSWVVFFIFTIIFFFLITVIKYIPLAHIRYLFPIFPLVIIIAIYFIYSIFQKLHLPLKFNSLNYILFALILIVFFFDYLNLFPIKHYALEYDSPQPNFKEAYYLLKQNKRGNDIVISPYSHLSKIYLGEKGISLPISLSGKKEDLENIIIKGFDSFTKTEIIKNDESLIDLLNNKNGFIVLDKMSVIRIEKQFKIIRNHPRVQEIYTSGKGLNRIWVYQF